MLRNERRYGLRAGAPCTQTHTQHVNGKSYSGLYHRLISSIGWSHRKHKQTVRHKQTERNLYVRKQLGMMKGSGPADGSLPVNGGAKHSLPLVSPDGCDWAAAADAVRVIWSIAFHDRISLFPVQRGLVGWKQGSWFQNIFSISFKCEWVWVRVFFFFCLKFEFHIINATPLDVPSFSPYFALVPAVTSLLQSDRNIIFKHIIFK